MGTHKATDRVEGFNIPVCDQQEKSIPRPYNADLLIHEHHSNQYKEI
jgi:hypothetical protein